mmetsp:Transcript_22412/g.48518  ORF Transcript_22412/g.48518 Transcript_22412/m.48518 type:complete len:256 (-) Transcript_22412:1285-2052(-)
MLYQQILTTLLVAVVVAQHRAVAFHLPRSRPATSYMRVAGVLVPSSLQMNAASEGGFFDEGKPSPTKDESIASEPTIDPDAAAGEFEEHIPRLNSVTLSGRAGSDPEPRYFDDGKVVLNLSLACKRKYHPLERKVRNIKYGEEETDWWSLELWGRDAEYASRFVTKGARIGVTGSVIMDSWQDRNTGENRTRHKILVKHLDILESRAEAELRRGNKGQYGGGGNNYAGGGNDDDGSDFFDGDGGPSPAGTGGFFD